MAFKLAPFSKAVYDVKFKPDRPPETHARRYFIALAVAIAFLTLIARLFQLTIVKGAYYRYLAENNRLREYALDGPRGVIFDRKGIILARSGSERERKEILHTRTCSCSCYRLPSESFEEFSKT